ncbi:MAG: hypothetical protein RIB45_10220 [Marivibrio sp.]|uniref:hypothetical protein n=1 Tax=Marivibrio sp. TaxID=2039719 RepID=UPI0032EFAFC5
MMSYHYLIPLVFSLPPGYAFTLAIPPSLLRRRLIGCRGAVLIKAIATCDGEERWRETRTVNLEEGEDDNHPITLVCAVNALDEAGALPEGAAQAFVEVEFLSTDDRAPFATKAPPAVYALYTAPGRLTFRADGSYKFGAPQVISSIAEYGRFLESHTLVAIDRSRQHLESLTLVNPYTKALLVSCQTPDGRTTKRTKVPARSAVRLDLTQLLREGEDRLVTRLQLSATNRVLTYHVRHDAARPPYISDHEHLDIFRADPSHVPWTRYLRERFARVMKQKFGVRIGG